MACLTRRQQEVAGLIAEGLANAEIAERLCVVEGTAANHVEAILKRLGFRSRTQVGVWAVEMGLYRPVREGLPDGLVDRRGPCLGSGGPEGRLAEAGAGRRAGSVVPGAVRGQDGRAGRLRQGLGGRRAGASAGTGPLAGS